MNAAPASARGAAPSMAHRRRNTKSGSPRHDAETEPAAGSHDGVWATGDVTAGSPPSAAMAPPVSARLRQAAEQRKSLILLLVAGAVAVFAVANMLSSTNQATHNAVLSVEELSRHKDPPSIYVALVGEVYDVTAGAQHYGPDGGYSFFAGKDASRAFITGEFTEQGLVDDVSGLAPAQLIDLAHWRDFYREHKEYHKVGVLAGRYFDWQGKPTQALVDVLNSIEQARQWRREQDALQEVFPPCNSRWRQGYGGEVWCSTRSGGIERDWVGVPRLMLRDLGAQPSCVCVAPSKLSEPKLREYEGCPPTAERCQVPES